MIRLILLIVFVAAVVALQASASQGPVEDGTSRPVPDAVADLGASGMAMARGTLERVRYGVGSVGSFFVRPTVLGMAEKNSRTVVELRPAIQRTNGLRRDRIQDIQVRMVRADSTAASKLEEGRPIAAVRYAMKSRGLLDAIRHQVVEETIR